MNINEPRLPIQVMPTRPLYKWSKIFNRLQRNFFVEPTKLRREKQIEDFVTLNGFKRPFVLRDTDILNNFYMAVDSPENADIVIVTDQKFSRYPCPELVIQISKLLTQCPNLYLCLNKHYINIDNSYHDSELDDNFNTAIGQWLRKHLPGANIVDLSLDFVDYGRSFSWAVPDRHFFIRYE